jgi:hypothetical protein
VTAPADYTLLVLVAHRDRMERELASAREIQLTMVPADFPSPTPSCPLELYATCSRRGRSVATSTTSSGATRRRCAS